MSLDGLTSYLTRPRYCSGLTPLGYTCFLHPHIQSKSASCKTTPSVLNGPAGFKDKMKSQEVKQSLSEKKNVGDCKKKKK